MAAQYPILRESLSGSPNDISQFPKQAGIINIRHPGYPKDEALLLVLYGYDDPEGSISFDTALAACAIVACNRFDGWISRDNSKEAPKLADVSLLPPGEYWFHVPIDDGQAQQIYRYPIIPNFRSWRFPQNVPPLWQMPGTDSVLLPQEIIASQLACRLTQQTLALDRAHIVPRTEDQWFMENEIMQRLPQFPDLKAGAVNLSPIDRDNNLLTLRTDVHRLWDQKQMTFVPKKSQDGQKHLVVHCLMNNPELIQLYHNRLLAKVHQPWELFLARFAYSLLPTAVVGFLGRRKPRVLRVVEDDGQTVEREFSATECDKFRCAPRPRSTSPKKRKAENDVNNKQEDIGLDIGIEDSASVSSNRSYTTQYSFDSGLGTSEDYGKHNDNHEYEISVRGRKRLRT